MAYFTGRHPECIDCKHFKPNSGSVHCLSCGAGEFFEEKIHDEQPDDEELMDIFAYMESQNNDQ